MAKIELGIVWAFSLLTIVTQSDIMFYGSVIASVTITLRNLPGACKVILIILYNLKRKLHKKLIDIQKNK
jgi:hypothetical protein